jgi:hypothetical protein
MVTFEPLLSLVGTWELVSFWWRMPDGQTTQPWGAHPTGRITYDSNGYVTALLMHESRNEAGGQSSPAEIQADFSAYFGSYIVDIEGGTIIHRVAGSLSAAHASGEIRRTFELNDGVLNLSFIRPREGVPVTYSLAWTRISPGDRRAGILGVGGSKPSTGSDTAAYC